jgi:Uncharacterized conserved protein (COG2071)
MRQPRLASVVERRLLVNYRVDPAVIAALLPAPLRPRQVRGWAVAGICLIRLGRVRPRSVPGGFGLRSENAAHRVAVEWDGADGPETGVYIPRRDSGSMLNVLVGGRLFPGRHHRASFDVRETSQDLHVAYAARDGATRVSVDVVMADRFEGSALFADLGQASAFFQDGSAGFSAGRDGRRLDGIELATDSWQVEPVEVRAVRSTFFDDEDRFPAGSAALDCALLMRDVPVSWNPLPPLPVRMTTGHR